MCALLLFYNRSGQMIRPDAAVAAACIHLNVRPTHGRTAYTSVRVHTR